MSEEQNSTEVLRLWNVPSPSSRLIDLSILGRLVSLHESSFSGRANDETNEALRNLRSAIFTVVTYEHPVKQVGLLLRAHINYYGQHEITDELMMGTGQAMLYFSNLFVISAPALRRDYNNGIASCISSGLENCGLRAFYRLDFKACLSHFEEALKLRQPCMHERDLQQLMRVCNKMLKSRHKLGKIGSNINTASACLTLCGPYKSCQWAMMVAYKVGVCVITSRVPIDVEGLRNDIEEARAYLRINDFQETPAYAAVLLASSLIEASLGHEIHACMLGRDAVTLLLNNIPEETSYRLLWASHIILCDHLVRLCVPGSSRKYLYGWTRTLITDYMSDRREATKMIAFTDQRIESSDEKHITLGQQEDTRTQVPESYLCECFLMDDDPVG